MVSGPWQGKEYNWEREGLVQSIQATIYKKQVSKYD